MPNHSYENEFNLHVNEISFSYEKMNTKTRFEEEAKGNSEMVYCNNVLRPKKMNSLYLFIFELKFLLTGLYFKNNCSIMNYSTDADDNYCKPQNVPGCNHDQLLSR